MLTIQVLKSRRCGRVFGYEAKKIGACEKRVPRRRLERHTDDRNVIRNNIRHLYSQSTAESRGTVNLPPRLASHIHNFKLRNAVRSHRQGCWKDHVPRAELSDRSRDETENIDMRGEPFVCGTAQIRGLQNDCLLRYPFKLRTKKIGKRPPSRSASRLRLPDVNSRASRNRRKLGRLIT
jgi:hypothetical protein